MKFRTCPKCKANNDHSEPCDCERPSEVTVEETGKDDENEE